MRDVRRKEEPTKVILSYGGANREGSGGEHGNKLFA